MKSTLSQGLEKKWDRLVEGFQNRVKAQDAVDFFDKKKLDWKKKSHTIQTLLVAVVL